MKNISIAGILVIILLFAGAGVTKGEADFREVNWGMSQDQVKETEPAGQLTGEMPGVLTYEGEIAGVKASIFYLFNDNKLNRGLYSIDSPQDSIIKDYEAIRSLLLKQYGEPDEVKIGPEDDMTTGDLDPANPDDLYTLVLRKSVSPETIWKRGNTHIYLRLIEQDGRVAIMVDYIIFPVEK